MDNYEETIKTFGFLRRIKNDMPGWLSINECDELYIVLTYIVTGMKFESKAKYAMDDGTSVTGKELIRYQKRLLKEYKKAKVEMPVGNDGVTAMDMIARIIDWDKKGDLYTDEAIAYFIATRLGYIGPTTLEFDMLALLKI